MNDLDCATTKDLLPEHAAGTLEGGAAARVRAHLSGCADCRGEAELLSLLRTDVELPAGLEERVVLAVRSGATRQARRPGVRGYAMAATLAFAAVTSSLIWQSLRNGERATADSSGAVAADVNVLRSPGLSALSEEELMMLLKEIES